MQMSQYCSSDMVKERQLSPHAQSGYLGPVLTAAATHMFCQRIGAKWDRFRSDAARLRESSFSKTLISEPQISCPSHLDIDLPH